MDLKNFFDISKLVLLIFKFSKNTPSNPINRTFGKLGKNILHFIFEKMRSDFSFISRKLKQASKMIMTNELYNYCHDFFIHKINSHFFLFASFWNGQVKKFLKDGDNFKHIQSISLNQNKSIFVINPLDESKLICAGKNGIQIVNMIDLSLISHLEINQTINSIQITQNKIFCASDFGIMMFEFDGNILTHQKTYLDQKKIWKIKLHFDNLYATSNNMLYNFFFNGNELKEQSEGSKKISQSFPIIDFQIDTQKSQIICCTISKIYLLDLADAKVISTIDNSEKSFFSSNSYTGFVYTPSCVICAKENGEIIFYSRQNLDQVNHTNLNKSCIKKMILTNKFSDFIFSTLDGNLNLFTLYSK